MHTIIGRGEKGERIDDCFAVTPSPASAPGAPTPGSPISEEAEGESGGRWAGESRLASNHRSLREPKCGHRYRSRTRSREFG